MEFDAILRMLQGKDPEQLAHDVMLFMLAFWLVKREVRGHFKVVEEKLASIAQSMENFTTSLLRIEHDHGSRIASLETKLNSKEGYDGKTI